MISNHQARNDYSTYVAVHKILMGLRGWVGGPLVFVNIKLVVSSDNTQFSINMVVLNII